MDCSLPSFSVHGIFQSRILKWGAISSSRETFQSRDRLHISCTGRWVLYCWATSASHTYSCKEFSSFSQSCLTLCDPMDCSPPGSSVHGIHQARILKWVAISYSRVSSLPGIESRSPRLQADSLPSEPPGKPRNTRVGSLALLQRDGSPCRHRLRERLSLFLTEGFWKQPLLMKISQILPSGLCWFWSV